MNVYFRSHHCCHPLEETIYFSQGRLHFKKGRMMRTSLHHVHAKERRRSSMSVQFIFLMVEA
jgi:hypothetical protein